MDIIVSRRVHKATARELRWRIPCIMHLSCQVNDPYNFFVCASMGTHIPEQRSINVLI